MGAEQHLLAGLRLLIPRAPERAGQLPAAIAALGGEARCLPALGFVATEVAESLHDALATVGTSDVAVFTSVTAVRFWQQHAEAVALPAAVVAVGDATAQALQQAGVAEVQVPVRQDAEGVLALVQRQGWRDVALITGVGGRPILREGLSAQGRLRVVELYARRPHPALTAGLAALGRWPNVVLASSAETYEALIQGAPDAGELLLQCPVVAPSERVIQHSRTLGSKAPAWLATPFGEAAVLDALKANWVRPSPPSARDDDRERR
ncbi:MAG: uroporphyrinogen-III synthase [Pseudomonadota bacterium]|nr:uroporphyrinogen-III synthase [Pseudomonadota bacterium]